MDCDSQLEVSMLNDHRNRRPDEEQRADYPPWLCESMSRHFAARARKIARAGGRSDRAGRLASAAAHYARLAGLTGEPITLTLLDRQPGCAAHPHGQWIIGVGCLECYAKHA